MTFDAPSITPHTPHPCTTTTTSRGAVTSAGEVHPSSHVSSTALEVVATAYVLEGEKLLMIKHPKFNKWLPPGGHSLVGELPWDTAKRETLEESGYEITPIDHHPLDYTYPHAMRSVQPFACQIEEIPATDACPAHRHLDWIYIAQLSKSTHNEASTYEPMHQEHAKRPRRAPLTGMSSSTSQAQLLPDALPHKWMTLHELMELQPDEIFPDTLEIAHWLLSQRS